MTRRTIVPRLPLASAAILAALAGCHGDADSPAAKTAEQAVGMPPGNEKSRSVETTRDVTVVKETKVIDNTTGQTISDTKEETPVKLTKEKQVRTDVKVDVGNTQAVKNNPK